MSEWIKIECDDPDEYYPTYYCNCCGAIVCVPSEEELPRKCKVCDPWAWYDNEGDSEYYCNDDDVDCRCD